MGRMLRKGHPLSAGTPALPKLFGASLGVALIAAPAASAFLGRQSIPRWLQKFGKQGAQDVSWFMKLLPT